MYRTQHSLFKKESLYLAGPMCFYQDGYDLWNAYKKMAEAKGYNVVLPNDHPLDLGNPDLQKRADSIMKDLADIMLDTTAIIADLEAYRGAEADCGTVFEIGMTYAKGGYCYGYTRDKRSLASKNQQSHLVNGKVYDEHGNIMPYFDLPFSPNLIGATKIVEGDFMTCLNIFGIDMEEVEKDSIGFAPDLRMQETETITTERTKPLVFLSTHERYDEDAKTKLEEMKALCIEQGLDVITPLDKASESIEINQASPYKWAASVFENNQRHIRNCDAVIANLNCLRGFEQSNDVAFECGMGYQLGKKMFGYMDDIRPLINKIPNLGEIGEYRDQAGANVENFNYPINLMFACTMNLKEGSFETVIEQIAKEIKAD